MKLPYSLLRACALLSVGSVAWAAGQRVVLTGNANLRAKPSMDAEILASLKKGDVFEASPRKVPAVKATSDEPTEWVEISAPASARVWIAAGLVDAATRTVKAERAHLRAGPGTNFAEVGHVPKGTVVDVATRLEGWIRIAAPPGAVMGYVSAGLTRPETGSLPAAGVAGVPETAAKTPAETKQPPVARVVPSSGFRPPPPPLPLARTGPTPLPPNASRPVVGAGRIVPPGSAVAGRPLVVPPPVPAVPVRVAEATPAPVAPSLPPPALSLPTEAARPVPADASAASVAAPNSAPLAPEPTIPAPSESGRQAEIVFLNEKPRPVVRQGVVALAVSPQAPGRYQLDSFRRGEGTLGFLISDDAAFDFEKWRSKQVVIQGEEYRDARWRTRSVIKVKSIEAVP